MQGHELPSQILLPPDNDTMERPLSNFKVKKLQNLEFFPGKFAISFSRVQISLKLLFLHQTVPIQRTESNGVGQSRNHSGVDHAYHSSDNDSQVSERFIKTQKNVKLGYILFYCFIIYILLNFPYVLFLKYLSLQFILYNF